MQNSQSLLRISEEVSSRPRIHSAAGAQAFDDLENMVEKLGDEYGQGLK